MGGEIDNLSRAEAASLLGWWLDAGVDAAISEQPRDWLKPSAAPVATVTEAPAPTHMPDTLEMPYRPDIVGAGAPGEKAHTYRLGGLTCLAGDVIGRCAPGISWPCLYVDRSATKSSVSRPSPA